jgi:hypothetical protein
MSDSEKTTLKVKDIESVGQKLDAFAETLPEQEREVLGWILARARAAGDADVPVQSVAEEERGQTRSGATRPPAGVARPQAFSSGLSKAAGLRPGANAASEIGVTWKHAFKVADTGRINPGLSNPGR